MEVKNAGTIGIAPHPMGSFGIENEPEKIKYDWLIPKEGEDFTDPNI